MGSVSIAKSKQDGMDAEEPEPHSPRRPKRDPQDEHWACVQCTLVNSSDRTLCQSCGHDRFPKHAQRPHFEWANVNLEEAVAAAPPPPPLVLSTDRPNMLTPPDVVFVSSSSQFTYGGESACPFGVLSLAEELLEGALNPLQVLQTANKKNEVESKSDQPRLVANLSNNEDFAQIFSRALSRAADCFAQYFANRPRVHSNPVELLRDLPGVFSRLSLATWSPHPIPKPFEQVFNEIVFPNVFLELGEIQINRFSSTILKHLLLGFQGSHSAISFVNIGYAFGVFCPAPQYPEDRGGFVVFDTHGKDFSRFGFEKQGAYLAAFLHHHVDNAVAFIETFTLESRNLMLSYSQGAGGAFGSDLYGDPDMNGLGLQQSEAINKVDLCVLYSASRSPAGLTHSPVVSTDVAASWASSSGPSDVKANNVSRIPSNSSSSSSTSTSTSASASTVTVAPDAAFSSGASGASTATGAGASGAGSSATGFVAENDAGL